jgi:hypothetical protein
MIGQGAWYEQPSAFISVYMYYLGSKTRNPAFRKQTLHVVNSMPFGCFAFCSDPTQYENLPKGVRYRNEKSTPGDPPNPTAVHKYLQAILPFAASQRRTMVQLLDVNAYVSACGSILNAFPSVTVIRHRACLYEQDQSAALPLESIERVLTVTTSSDVL